MSETTPSAPYWSQSVAITGQELASTPQGLSTQEAFARLRQHGPNSLQSKSQASALGLLINQFKSPIVLILIFAALISAFLQDWPDALIILLIVLGSGLLSFYQEYGANNAAKRLKEQVSFKTSVLRNGQPLLLPTAEIVPGDVVQLSAGSLIPADGIILSAKDFFVDQAVLTGETFPVEKKPGILPANSSLAQLTNAVFMGTSVRSGQARVMSVKTGLHTEFGQIASRLNVRPPQTEFQNGIRQLGYLLTEIMFVLVLGIFFFNVLFHKPVIDSFLFSMALAVGLTPQLLPAIISINLAKGSQAMAQRGVIVRRLESIENFGSMDVLCTDKTGTLTQGVVKLDGALDIHGNPSAEVGAYAYLNAALQTGMPNPLDAAIISQGTQTTEGYHKVDEIPYDFTRKRLSIVVANPQDTPLLITKGALHNVLAACTAVNTDGQIQPLDESYRTHIQTHFEAWSAQGYRVLGLATKPLTTSAHGYTLADETQMTFAGFLLFFDPPKGGVKETLQALANLGVQVKVITGDNNLVARHTAQMVGLDEHQILTGEDLNRMRDEALWHAVENNTIFAEVDPNQKERIILALKKRGHVVGYMGDGVNDAPSLHSADVGISVENAVDVAKEAADLVLLKQDLDVLRQGIEEGRKTFANTLKYIFMATSANFGNMFSMAGASLFLPFLPMLPKQILLINFLTDLPEMTIATDRVDTYYTERPHRMDIHFIRRFMLAFGGLSSVFDYATFAVLLWVLRADPAHFQTAWFIESIFSACLVVFAIRTRLPLLQSRPSNAMLTVTGTVMLVTLALPYSPLASPLGFTPLPFTYLGVILALVLCYLISAEVTKQWFYRWMKD